ncbi:OmpA family protein [Croceitalea dokdonensis]|nr:OmpA family protein [Croceitalea dokdonensis]
MIITIATGTFLYFSLCSDCQLAAAEPEKVIEEDAVVATPDPTSFPFAVADGDFELNVNDNFNFDLSNYGILVPLTENLKGGISNLVNFLKENQTKVINITGLYRSDEENPSAFPNLGLARATAVKNYLVEQGISSAQTNTFGKLMENLIPDGNTLRGPVTFNLSEGANVENEDLKALYDEIKANPLVLYFNTGEAAINLSLEQRQKVAKIARYLDKVPDAGCDVIGHTDNTGSRATNLALGKERADFAKSYLVRNGITAEKINSLSKGPDAPIASNGTEEGRSKNRRTVITLH